MGLNRGKMGRFVALSLVMAISFVEIGNAAPARYDQRQEGKLNVHANLENFLVVVATSGSQSGGLLSDIAAQALELKDLASRAATSKGNEETVEYKVDEGPLVYERNKEPYRVEIVRIQKDESHHLEDDKKKIEEQQNGEQNEKTLKDVDISISGGTGERKKEEIIGSLPPVVGKEQEISQGKLIIEKIREVEGQSPGTIPAKTANVQEIPQTQENQQPIPAARTSEEKIKINEPHAESNIPVIKTSDSKEMKKEIPGENLPIPNEMSIPVVTIISEDLLNRNVRDTSRKLIAGISVKKELSRKDSAIPDEGNETDSLQDKPEEYKLLTDGVHGLENCGPDGYRDNKNLMCKIKKESNVAI